MVPKGWYQVSVFKTNALSRLLEWEGKREKVTHVNTVSIQMASLNYVVSTIPASCNIRARNAKQ